MKKAKTAKKMVSMTMDGANKWARSEKGKKAIERIAQIPDDRIDTSDIPELGDQNGVRIYDHPEHPLYRALTQQISIRVPLPDLAIARELASEKGVPYQTYMKTLLHEALKRERATPRT